MGLSGRCLTVYLSEAQNPIPSHPITHCICVYSTLIHTGKGGGFEPEKRLEGNSSQSWVENTNMTALPPAYKFR